MARTIGLTFDDERIESSEHKSFDDMTKAELYAWADAREIELPKNVSKPVLVAALEEAWTAPEDPADGEDAEDPEDDGRA